MNFEQALANLPECDRPLAVAHYMTLMSQEPPRIGPQSLPFGRRATDRLVPTSYLGMKTADAAESVLRATGREMTRHELIDKLQAGGCEVTLKNLCITIGSNSTSGKLAIHPRFYEDGNLVGLVAWQERKAA